MILALQTVSPTTELWLINADQVIEHQTWESGRELSTQLLERLTQLLAKHQHQLADLTGLAIFSGPGSFTSLRIGHTTLNALADGLNIPVAGANGDDWLAQALAALKTTPPSRPALPFYGSEANITRPKH